MVEIAAYVCSGEGEGVSSPSSPRPGDVVLESDPWQDNWLFRRHKVALHRHDPVAMVIPEASDLSARATVGER